VRYFIFVRRRRAVLLLLLSLKEALLLPTEKWELSLILRLLRLLLRLCRLPWPATRPRAWRCLQGGGTPPPTTRRERVPCRRAQRRRQQHTQLPPQLRQARTPESRRRAHSQQSTQPAAAGDQRSSDLTMDFTLNLRRSVYVWPQPTNMMGAPLVYTMDSAAPTCPRRRRCSASAGSRCVLQLQRAWG